MAFCRYSIDQLANNTTSVDNIFINNYLPFAPAEAVKVYLYGLLKCQDASASDNTLQRFASDLKMSEQDIESCFTYWQDQGLVQILNVMPFEVRYLPISDVISNTKKYNPKKYESFNAQAQDILRGRMITPNEYREYYDILERFHMEKDALLMIIKYCVDIKGEDVGYAYITTVAKDWANQKITTAKQVEERVLEFKGMYSGLSTIKKLLGQKSLPSVEEISLYKKWFDEGFDEETLNYVAQNLKKRKASIAFMDSVLDKYFAKKLFSISEIELYEGEKAAAFELAKIITKNMGLYYENLEPVVDEYVFDWLRMGFSSEMLKQVANYCFKQGIRTLDGMNNALLKFKKLGILTEKSLEEFIGEVVGVDKKIKEILESIGLSRGVNQFDRDKYKIWTQVWQLPSDVIDYACTISVGKDQPMQYLSGVLSSMHDKNIKTVDDAKKSFAILSSKSKKSDFTGRSYSKEEMNSLFQSIEEIEV